ncbi:MFS transporter [Microlunatus sp. GCM10028923]|uniref:MFS transporter n=1 Tax=Microlunatus sp. GCM10028923 TaxID=3273400 RepID=UPI0036110261
MSPRSVFAERDFRLLLAGQTASQLGSQVSSVALPLLAVITLGASSFEVGLINAAATVAFAVIGLPAGAWLDRRTRRPVLVAADLVRAALLATIPAAAALGRLSILQLIMVALLVGAARVFFDIGYRSYLPTVTGRDRVLAGNSVLEFVRASGQVTGPGLGGLLVALIGGAGVLALQAGTFALSAITLLAIRTREVRPAQAPRRRGEIREGLHYVWRQPLLRATAAASALGNLSFAIASAVSTIFLARTLGLSPALIGLIIASGSATVLAGAALTPRLARRWGSVRLSWLSLAVTAPLSIVGVLAQPGWSTMLVIIGIAAGELGQIVYAITSLSLRQRTCPDHLLGRVNATMTVLIMGLFPLGALAGGALGDLIGPRATLLVAGVLLSLAPILLYAGLRGVPEPDEAGPADLDDRPEPEADPR